jgi:cytochrome c peroxidase
MGRFRVPTLRNIAVTAPYMHDGSIATLDEVLDHYASGGRTIPSGPYAGNGSANPLKSPFMVGFTLTEQERADVLAFFESLTDRDFLSDPRFADPWPP